MNTAIPRVLENKTIVIKVGGSTLGEGDSTIPVSYTHLTLPTKA